VIFNLKIKIKENIPLVQYTTFKIGGRARYFTLVKNEEEIVQAVDFSRSKKIPFFILGGGSNLLVSDKGFKGLVIKVVNKGFRIYGSEIRAAGGTLLSDLVKTSVKSGLTGLEWAVGVPGTIGGAVKVNASAFGRNMAEIVKKCFKKKGVIFEVILRLKKGNPKESQQLIRQYIRQRKESQPLNFPSAGCIFKNPPGYFAGQLIEKCGLKGKKIGQAMISEKHANFIINLGHAQASEVVQLIELVKKNVKDKFGIELEEEIKYLGFD